MHNTWRSIYLHNIFAMFEQYLHKYCIIFAPCLLNNSNISAKFFLQHFCMIFITFLQYFYNIYTKFAIYLLLPNVWRISAKSFNKIVQYLYNILHSICKICKKKCKRKDKECNYDKVTTHCIEVVLVIQCYIRIPKNLSPV